MIIRPGVDPPSTVNMVELTRQSSRRRVDILFQDSEGNAIDIDETILASGSSSGALDLEIVNLSNHTLLSESYWPKDNPPGNRITKDDTGTYSVTLTESETATTGQYLANWHARQNSTTEDVYRTQVIEVVSPRVLALLPSFRLMVDRTVKPVLPEEFCFLGWTDSMLAIMLQLGLHKINAYQPYPCWRSLDEFPTQYYSEILIRAAVFESINSMLVFSIDTDVPNYNDSGHSFVMNHMAPLQNYLNSLSMQLDKEIPKFKMHFVNSGSVAVEYRYNNYYYALLASSPYGSILRGGIPNTTA